MPPRFSPIALFSAEAITDRFDLSRCNSWRGRTVSCHRRSANGFFGAQAVRRSGNCFRHSLGVVGTCSSGPALFHTSIDKISDQLLKPGYCWCVWGTTEVVPWKETTFCSEYKLFIVRKNNIAAGFAPSLQDGKPFIHASPGLRFACPGLFSLLPPGE